jgi:hypothetical protein
MWNILHLSSIYKKGDHTCPDNYRGIAVMNVFAKLYSTCINAKLE